METVKITSFMIWPNPDHKMVQDRNTNPYLDKEVPKETTVSVVEYPGHE